MSNYELKAKVLENGLAKVQRDVSLTMFRYVQGLEDGIDYYMPLDIQEAKDIDAYMKANYSEEWKEAYRVNDASYHRTKRLRNRISSFLTSGNCIFLTLTFTDKVFETTSKETRRKYVARYLKENCSKYVANIDYGKKNDREHYHAVVLADSIDGSYWRKNYGNIDFERIKYCNDNSEKDITTEKKLSKYIDKLTNHAIKETTKRNYLIYSRS